MYQNSKRASRQAKAIARKAERRGEEVKGKDKVKIRRINGESHKVFVRSIDGEND